LKVNGRGPLGVLYRGPPVWPSLTGRQAITKEFPQVRREPKSKLCFSLIELATGKPPLDICATDAAYPVKLLVEVRHVIYYNEDVLSNPRRSKEETTQVKLPAATGEFLLRQELQRRMPCS
jgi:hypothetical protein